MSRESDRITLRTWIIPVFLTWLVTPFAGINAQGPVMVDSSHDCGPVGDFVCSEHPYTDLRGWVCPGENVNLLLTMTRFGNEGPRHIPYWHLIRTNKDGELLDSIPVPLFSYVEVWDYKTTIWHNPYFYVVFEKDNNLCYLRFTEGLSFVDESPVSICGTHWNDQFRLMVDGEHIWIIRYRNISPGVFAASYTFPDFAADLSEVEVLVSSDEPFHVAAANGLYITVGTEGHRSNENYYVSNNGDVIRMADMTFADFYGCEFVGFTGLQYGLDSALFCFFDEDSEGNGILQYYFLTRFDSSAIITPTRIDLPFKPYTYDHDRFSFRKSDGAITGISTYGGTVGDNVALVKFDPIESALILADRFDSLWVPGDRYYYGVDFLDTSGFYFYNDSGNPSLMTFTVDSPLVSVSNTPLFYNSGHARYPTLLRDDKGLLLCSQFSDINGQSLKMARFDNPSTADQYELQEMLEGTRPLRPELFNVRDKCLITWFEDATGLAESQVIDAAADPAKYYNQQVVLFDERFPSAQDLANRIELYNPKWGDLTSNHSTVAVLDSMLYLGVSPYRLNWSHNYLWQYDINREEMDGPIAEFWATGLGQFIDQGDSILWLHGFYDCLDYDIFRNCLEWEQGVRGWWIGSGPFTDFGPFYYNPSSLLPYDRGNWSVFPFGDTYVISLLYSQELIRIDLSTGLPELLIDMSPYVNYPVDVIWPFKWGEVGVVIMMSRRRTEHVSVILDDNWEYVNTATFSTVEYPIDLSEFVCLPNLGKVFFAYSAYVPYPYAASRIHLQSIDLDVITAVDEGEPRLPSGYSLEQNYPNPFNSGTAISFVLAKHSDVKLDVFNVLGRKVTTLADQELSAGRHTVWWDGSNAASGVYLYRLEAGEYVETRKMLLLK